MWAFTWSRTAPRINGMKVQAQTTHYGTSVLIHRWTTQSQPPTRPYTYEANTPENKAIVAAAFAAN
jgi:hypothetical protein